MFSGTNMLGTGGTSSGGPNRQREPVMFNSCVALAPSFESGDVTGFITSSGPADPRLHLRHGNSLVDLIGFESNVFQILTPSDALHLGGMEGGHNALGSNNGSSSRAAAAAAASTASTSGGRTFTGGSSSVRGIESSGITGSGSAKAALAISGPPTATVAYGSKFCLMHKQSGMLLALLATQPSTLDSRCFTMVLVPATEASSSAHFKFSPRYKIHSDGDTVCSGDQVVVQLFGRPVFLHLSLASDFAVVRGGGFQQGVGASRERGDSYFDGGMMSPQTMARNRTLSAGPLGMTSRAGDTSQTADDNNISQSVFAVAEDTDEVNGCDIPTAWTVLRYDIGSDDAAFSRLLHSGQHGVFAGVPVAIYHREREMVMMTDSYIEEALITMELDREQERQRQQLATSLREDNNPLNASVSSGYSNNYNKPTTSTTTAAGGSLLGAPGSELKRTPSSLMNTFRQARSPSRMIPISPSTAPNMAPSTLPPLSTGGTHPQSSLVVSNSPMILQPIQRSSVEDFSFNTLQCRCTALWIFEHSNPLIGGPLRVREKYRIRQAATNRFLSVRKDTSGVAVSSDGGGGGGSDITMSMNPTPLRGSSVASPGGGIGGPFAGSAGVAALNSGVKYKLELIPPPTTDIELQSTLFTLSTMLDVNSEYITQQDFMRFKHCDTGLWLGTGNFTVDTTPTSNPDSQQQGGGPRSWANDTTPATSGSRTLSDALKSPISPISTGSSPGNHFNRTASRNVYGTHVASATSSGIQLTSMSLLLKPQPQDAILIGHVVADLQRSVLHLFRFSESLARIRDYFASLGHTKADFTAPETMSVMKSAGDSLIALICFCTESNNENPFEREGLPQPHHQQMMFDLMLHRLVFDVIVAPFIGEINEGKYCDKGQGGLRLLVPALPLKGGGFALKDVKFPENEPLFDLLRLAFRLLKQMIKENPTLASHLAPYCELMLAFDGLKLHVADTMIELFTGNIFLPRPLKMSTVAHYVSMVRNKTRSGGYLRILSASAANAEFRHVVCQKLIVDNKSVLMSVAMPSPHSVGIELSGKDFISLPDFLLHHDSPKEVKFFESQIELFCQLSQGSIPFCVQALQPILPQQHCSWILQHLLWTTADSNNSLSKLDLTRAYFLEIALNIHVLPRLREAAVQLRVNVPLMASSKLRDNCDSYSGVMDTDVVKSIKEMTCRILKDNPFQTLENQRRNTLLKACITSWKLIIQHWQYTEANLSQIVPMLVSILDATGDSKTLRRTAVEERGWDRFTMTEEGLIAWQVKEAAVETLNLVLHNVIHVKANELILYFSTLNAMATTATHNSNHRRRGTTNINNTNASHEEQQRPSPQHPAVYMEKLQEATLEISSLFQCHRLLPLLLEVARYDMLTLSRKVLDFISRLGQVRQLLFEKVSSVPLSRDRDITEFFDNSFDMAHELLEKIGDVSVASLTVTEHAANVPSSSAVRSGDSSQYQYNSATPQSSGPLTPSNTADWGGGASSGSASPVGSPAGGGSDLIQSSSQYAAPIVDVYSKGGGGGGNALESMSLEYITDVTRPSFEHSITKLLEMVDRGCGPRRSQSLGVRILRHWGIHLVMMRLLQRTPLKDPLYPLIIRFFLKFSRTSQSCARRLAPFTDVFLAGVPHPTAHNDCLRILIAVMSSGVGGNLGGGTAAATTSTRTGSSTSREIDMRLIHKIGEMILHESTQDSPDSSLLQMINKSCAAEALPFSLMRELVEILRNGKAFESFSSLSPQWRSAKLGFVSSLLIFLNHYANCTQQSRNEVNQIISPIVLFQILLRGRRGASGNADDDGQDDDTTSAGSKTPRSRTALTSQSRSSTAVHFGRRSSGHVSHTLPLHVQGPCFRLLGSLWAYGEESGYELQRLRAQWTCSPQWWALMGSLSEELSKMVHSGEDLDGVAATPATYQSTGETIPMSTFFNHYVLPCVRTYFENCFTISQTGHKQDVGLATRGFSLALKEFVLQNLDQYANINVRDCVIALQRVCDDLDMKNVAANLADLYNEIEAKMIQASVLLINTNKPTASNGGGAEPSSPNGRFEPATSKSTAKNDDQDEAEYTLDPLPEEYRDCCVTDAPLSDLVTLLQSAKASKTAVEDNFTLKALLHLKRADLSVKTTVSLLKLYCHVLTDTENEKELIATQDHLDRLGMMRVATTLTESKSDDVVMQAYSLGIALLEGGNTQVQNRMLDYFDTHDEKFFFNIRITLERCRLAIADFKKRGKNFTKRTISMLDTTLQLTETCFRFVQLMCEGHHLGMQHYIRDQLDNLHSVNVVFEVAQLMKDLCLSLVPRLYPVLITGFALLTEVCQGPCSMNQFVLLNNGICGMICQAFEAEVPEPSYVDANLPNEDADDSRHDSNKHHHGNDGGESSAMNWTFELPDGIDHEELGSLLSELKSRATTTLLAILEGCTDEFTYRSVAEQVPPSIVADLLKSTLGDRDQMEIANQLQNDDDTETVFNLLIYLVQVRPYARSAPHLADLSSQIDVAINSYNYLSRFLGCVEIQREERLENLFFRVPRLCMSLTTQSKDQLLWSVDRSNRSTKLADFIQQVDEIIFEMDVTHRLEQQIERLTTFSTLKNSFSAAIYGTSEVKEGGSDGGDDNESGDRNDSTSDTEEIPLATGRFAFIINFLRKSKIIVNGKLQAYPALQLLLKMVLFAFAVVFRCLVWCIPHRIKQQWNSIIPYLVTHKIDYYESMSLFLAGLMNFVFIIFEMHELPVVFLFFAGVLQLYCSSAVLIIDTMVLLPSYFYRNKKRNLRRKTVFHETESGLGGGGGGEQQRGTAITTKQGDAADDTLADSVVIDGSITGGKAATVLSKAATRTSIVEADAFDIMAVIRAVISLKKRIMRSRLIQAGTRIATVYRAVMVLASILGLLVSNLFFAVHLVGLIQQSSVLMNVIVAITTNGKSLLLTMGLGVVMVYFFAIVGNRSFPNSYGEREFPPNALPSTDNNVTSDNATSSSNMFSGDSHLGSSPILVDNASTIVAIFANATLNAVNATISNATRFNTTSRNISAPLSFSERIQEIDVRDIGNAVLGTATGTVLGVYSMVFGAYTSVIDGVASTYASATGNDGDPISESNCDSLGRCFAFILVHGLRQGGGVGDIMAEVPWSSPGLVGRMGYDFLFFALVNVVFLNILFGIIIDAFAELRDDKRKKEDDMNGICFICGTAAETLEKHAVPFLWHVKHEHNMWQYLYLMYHLRNKDPNEYTGQESYVQTLLEKGSLAFFPEETSLSLQKKQLAMQMLANSRGGSGGADAGSNADSNTSSGGHEGGTNGKASADDDVDEQQQNNNALNNNNQANVAALAQQLLETEIMKSLGADMQSIKGALQEAQMASNRSLHSHHSKKKSTKKKRHTTPATTTSSSKLSVPGISISTGAGDGSSSDGSSSSDGEDARRLQWIQQRRIEEDRTAALLKDALADAQKRSDEQIKMTTSLLEELKAAHGMCDKLSTALIDTQSEKDKLQETIKVHEATINSLSKYVKDELPKEWQATMEAVMKSREEAGEYSDDDEEYGSHRSSNNSTSFHSDSIHVSPSSANNRTSASSRPSHLTNGHH